MATRKGATLVAGGGHHDTGRAAEATPILPSHVLQALHRHMRSSLFNATCADIRIRAFGRTYALHRVFLVQSTFFHSLLDGEFQEAQVGLGVWRSSGSQSTTAAVNVMELHFDDPNITRPAFEFCIAALYGTAPQLVLPTWSSPSPAYPLTSAFESDQLFAKGKSSSELNQAPDGSDDDDDDDDDGDDDGEGKRDDGNEAGSAHTHGPQHPATPRFLLSLLATAKYLGIPSIATQAVTLILCSITPFTVSHYLRFSLGYGIHGAMEAKGRRMTGCNARWDWELEGPAWGLAGLAQEERSPEHTGRNTLAALSEQAQRMSIGQTDTTVRKQGASAEDSTLEYQTSIQGFFYGAQADKIGEACSCWLLRWGVSVLDVEEKIQVDGDVCHADEGLLPRDRLPVNHNLTPTDYPTRVASLLPAPSPAVWRHPKLGGIPARWVRATVSSDSFWVNEEYCRYDTARRIVVMRRAYVYGDQSGSRSHDDGGEDDLDTKQTGDESVDENRRAQNAPTDAGGDEADDDDHDAEDEEADEEERDETEYNLLFAEGVYYTHMSFGRLSVISNDVCPHTGLPYAPMHVLQSALWTQSELKSVILSKNQAIVQTAPRARNEEEVEETGAAVREDPSAPHRGSINEAADASAPPSGAAPQDEEADRELGLVSSDTDFVKAQRSLSKRARRSRISSLGDDGLPMRLGGMKPLMLLASPPSSSANNSTGAALEGLLTKRFYAIPVDDTVRVGESLATLAAAAAAAAQHPNGLIPPEAGNSSTDGPTGVASAFDPHALASTSGNHKRHDSKNFFGLENAVKRGNRIVVPGAEGGSMKGANGGSSDAEDVKQRSTHQWTGFEPMRIGVEFYDVDRLSEKQRLYSPSFFYAGSVWNLYVQTVKKSKGLQLGIYLHRQNYNDGLPNPSAPSRPLAAATQDRRRQSNIEAPNTSDFGAHDNPQTPQRGGQGGPGLSRESVFYDASAAALQDSATSRTAAQYPHRTMLTTPARFAAAHIVSPYSLTPSPMASNRQAGGVGITGGTDAATWSRLQVGELENLVFAPADGATPAAATMSLPLDVPYLDERRYLRAYFAIHCPSPMGTSLTKFSSRPDNFTLSQSWGWKSSSLLGAVYLEDGVLGTAKSQVSQTFRCVVTMGVV